MADDKTLQSLVREAKGLYVHQNPLHRAPPGSCSQLENCSLGRDGIYGKRVGFKNFGAAQSQEIKELFEYRGGLVARDSLGAIKASDAGSAPSYSWPSTYAVPGAWEAAKPTARMRAIEMRGNFYFTSARGLYKNDAVDGTPRLAGLPRGQQPRLALTGTGGSWFYPGRNVAYKVAYKTKDANDFVVRSAACARVLLNNPFDIVSVAISAGKSKVEVSDHTAHGYSSGDLVYINEVGLRPDLFETGDHGIDTVAANTYEYDRFAWDAGDAATSTTAKAGKRFDVALTIPIETDTYYGVKAGDVLVIYRTAQTANDDTPPSEVFYQVAEIELDATDISNGYVSYTDTAPEAFLGDELEENPTKQTVTRAPHRPPFAYDLAAFRNHLWLANTHREYKAPCQLSFIENLSVGNIFRLYNGTSNEDYTAQSTESVGSKNFKLFTSEDTEAANTRKTCESLVYVINSGSTEYRAEYVSDSLDAPGKLLIEKRDLAGSGASSFQIKASGGSDAWTPDLSTEPYAERERYQNRLYYSLRDRPEAVPLFNYDEIGSKDFAILRILPLKDSLIILKEEGVWRVSGDLQELFDFSQLDPSVRLVAPETAVVLNNSVYCASNMGVVKINETGTQVVGRNIKVAVDEARDLISTFGTDAFATAYEAEHLYILTCARSSAGTDYQQYVYDYLTSEWAEWEVQLSTFPYSMLEIKVDRRLYHSGGALKFLQQSREARQDTGDEWCDESIEETVTSSASSTEITYSSSDYQPQVGDMVENRDLATAYDADTTEKAWVDAVSGGGPGTYTLTLSAAMTLGATDTFVITRGVRSKIKWNPDSAQNAGVMKFFSFMNLSFERAQASQVQISVSSDVNPNTASFSVDLPGGDSEANLRVPVPLDHRYARALTVTLEHYRARENFALLQRTLDFRVVGRQTARVGE